MRKIQFRRKTLFLLLMRIVVQQKSSQLSNPKLNLLAIRESCEGKTCGKHSYVRKPFLLVEGISSNRRHKKIFCRLSKNQMFLKLFKIPGKLHLMDNNKIKEFQPCRFIKKETPEQMFPCEICKIFNNIFFIEHLRTTASIKVSFAQLCIFV